MTTDKYITVWIVDGSNAVSSHRSASEAARKARADPTATIHKERIKIRQDASNAEINKAYQSAASGYSQRKGCPLWMLIYVCIPIAVLCVIGNMLI
jgi:hypothetical protein